MKLFFLCILCLSLVACSSVPKQPVVYTSDWATRWQAAIMKKCSLEAAIISISIYDSKQALGYSMSKEQFDRVGRMLNESCLMYYKVVI